jgi:hypothetical protein
MLRKPTAGSRLPIGGGSGSQSSRREDDGAFQKLTLLQKTGAPRGAMGVGAEQLYGSSPLLRSTRWTAR